MDVLTCNSVLTDIFYGFHVESKLSITRIEVNPIKLNGDVYVTGIEKRQALFFFHLKESQTKNPQKAEELATNYGDVWVCMDAFSSFAIDRVVNGFRKQCEELPTLYLQYLSYRTEGNSALQEEWSLYASKKIALKDALECRKRRKDVKMKCSLYRSSESEEQKHYTDEELASMAN